MRFPKTIKYREHRAVIYGKQPSYDYYRVKWKADGKWFMRSFRRYSDALAEAEKRVREVASGSKLASLTLDQADAALGAFRRLEKLRLDSGKVVSLHDAVSSFCDATAKLNGASLVECVEHYLATKANVRPMDIGKAIELFIDEREQKTLAKEGKRPRLSPEQHYQTKLWLREFANTFPGHLVSDLTKAHLTEYMKGHAKVGPKTRNERRGIVRMFFNWCVEQDYLAPAHRLFETTALKNENADPEEIEFYRPKELRALLEAADAQLLPVLALAGLAGIRFKEILRLDWGDVFRVAGHIEVKAHKSKTRSRRLIEICPALAQWLETYRAKTGKVWPKGYDMLHEDFGALRESLRIPGRRNGLRHSFITYHFAQHANENLTAALAGNSPAMIHSHYKGLATKVEAEKWFGVKPASEANVISFAADARV